MFKWNFKGFKRLHPLATSNTISLQPLCGNSLLPPFKSEVKGQLHNGRPKDGEDFMTCLRAPEQRALSLKFLLSLQERLVFFLVRLSSKINFKDEDCPVPGSHSCS